MDTWKVKEKPWDAFEYLRGVLWDTRDGRWGSLDGFRRD